MERKILTKFYHRHPLILTTIVSNNNDSRACYVCGHPIMNLDEAYACIRSTYFCSTRIVVHKKCGELPNQISHQKHPQHPLYLFDHHACMRCKCDLCRLEFGKVLGYRCSICVFDIDINCEKLGIDALLEERKELKHPSHPHPLTLMRKAAFSFYCDGCGARDVDMAYICSICEFWVHKSCALLPQLLPINSQYHHHHLSLAFSLPKQLRFEEFWYKCDVCGKDFDTTCWLYFCGDCRFFGHLKCVTSTSETTKKASSDDDDGNNVIQLPLHAHDLCKKLITPFVMREKGLEKIPDVEEMPTTVEMAETTARFSFLSNYHKHPLSLVTEFSDEDDNNGDNDSEEEEEDDAYDLKLKICDVCVSPISSPPYYECPSACKYFVHSTCYLLPQTLSSSAASSSSSSSSHLYGDCPETHDKAHKFTLYTSSESTDMSTGLYRCDLCIHYTNGRMYECQGCKMKVDVKCASLPTTVRHAFHRRHKPLTLSRIPPQADKGSRKRCIVCIFVVSDCVAYCCYSEGCDFALHLDCALLPKSITKREWDEHPLLLMSDASLDHPSDFYCDFCEVELHPKKPMYHCRACDHSFHLGCLKSASGWYTNIKVGRRFELDGLHPHPLTFNHVTLKKRCDICGAGVYNYCGLECTSCNYAVCLDCGRQELCK